MTKETMSLLKKYDIPIVDVISDKNGYVDTSNEAYVEKGVLINSGEFTGLGFDEAFKAISKKLSSLSMGEEKTNYRLRDWGVSRQRYWGCPIPIIQLFKCGAVPENLDKLPVRLPENVAIDGAGSPLKKMSSFVNTSVQNAGRSTKRDRHL